MITLADIMEFKMLPVWKLQPINPASPSLKASSYSGELVIRTASESRAREIADGLFLKAHDRVPDAGIFYSFWARESEVACAHAAEGEFAAGATEAILSPRYYDTEFQERLKDGTIRPAD